MKDKEKIIEIKHGSENMVDLLNQEQAELQKTMIEEMAKDLKECLPNNWYWQKSVDSDTYLVAKHFYNAGYRKLPEGSVVLSKEEYNALISEFNALRHKYSDICDRYRLCKDTNETIKQHAVIARKETAKEFAKRLKKEPKIHSPIDGYDFWKI